MANQKNQRKRGTDRPRARKGRRPTAMVFSRPNYLLLLLGLAVIVVGYVIMRVENEVDGFLSLYVAPLLILGGYLEIIYAIFYRAKSEKESDPA